MTCCLAVTLPNFALAAADTRVTLHFDGQQQPQDGPGDLTINVAKTNSTLTIPFSYRKIRRVSDGWAVCAGEQSIGTEFLNVLNRHDGILFTRARSLLLSDAGLSDRVVATTGMGKDEILNTVILAAPFGSNAHPWILCLRPGDERTIRRANFLVTNWPHSVPLSERARAETELRNALSQPLTRSNAFASAKAVASVIATAERHSQVVGPYIQVGLTFVAEGVKRSVYYQGKTEDLLVMSEAEFEKVIVPAQ